MINRLVLFFTLLTITTSAQDFQQECRKLIEEKKWDEVLPLLKQWEKEEPTNAEMRIAYYNFYLEQSKGGLQAGSGQGAAVYDEILFTKALDELRKGLKRHPKRLDMHLGIVFSLRDKGDIEAHVKEMSDLIDLNEKLKSKWLSTNNEPVKEPEKFFKGSVQANNHKLFTMKEPQLDAVETISRKMMQYYPEDAENYSNIGACHMLKGNKEEALNYFHQALDKAPGDMLIVSNIARAYMELGQKDKAIEYYEILERQGNWIEMDFAKQRLLELRGGAVK